jgi:hypothetical protein
LKLHTEQKRGYFMVSTTSDHLQYIDVFVFRLELDNLIAFWFLNSFLQFIIRYCEKNNIDFIFVFYCYQVSKLSPILYLFNYWFQGASFLSDCAIYIILFNCYSFSRPINRTLFRCWKFFDKVQLKLPFS